MCKSRGFYIAFSVFLETLSMNDVSVYRLRCSREAVSLFKIYTCMLVSVSFLLQVIALVGGSHDTSQSSLKHSDWQDSGRTRARLGLSRYHVSLMSLSVLCLLLVLLLLLH